jgi:hypothetical protein
MVVSLFSDPLSELLIELIFMVIFAFGLCMTYCSHRWKLIVAEDELVFTPVFGKDRKVFVSDVTHLKVDPALGIRVYQKEKKLFEVGLYASDRAMLVSYMIEKGVRVPDKINL